MNCLTRRLGLDVETRPDVFNLNAVLATARKGPQATENLPFEVQYCYHFDSALLQSFLCERACAMGVGHRQARVARIQQHEDGQLRSLHTDANEVIDGFRVVAGTATNTSHELPPDHSWSEK